MKVKRFSRSSALSMLAYSSSGNPARDNPQGQILASHRLGEWIGLLAASARCQNIVEIGTWKGLGSTRLLANALESRPDAHALSIEANRLFHTQAKKNLTGCVNLTLLYGTLVSESDLDVSDLTPEESAWLSEDILNFGSAPNVLPEMPDRVDFLLLDGGEFSSKAEFNILLPRLQGFVLLMTPECGKIEMSKPFSSLRALGFVLTRVTTETDGPSGYWQTNFFRWLALSTPARRSGPTGVCRNVSRRRAVIVSKADRAKCG